MNFQDRAIIVEKKPLKERSYIVTALTENHGLYSGVFNQYSKKSGDSFVPGNLVDFSWNARLHEHIGMLKLELVKACNANLIYNKTKLYSFNSVVSLLKMAFYERAPHNNLFPSMLAFMQSMSSEFDIVNYFKLELAILEESGYKLQLDKCVVTGESSNLFYVSPKSGCAVSKDAGREYASKLLIMPMALRCNLDFCTRSIKEFFDLTCYFFERYICVNAKMPEAWLVFKQHASEIYSE